MARQKIDIQAVSNIIIAQSKRQYFTITDMTQSKFICFITKLKPFCQVGKMIDAEVSPGKSPSNTPRIEMIYINDKAVIEIAPKAPTGRSYGKSDKELAQQKQLEDEKRRSIEAQTAVIQAVELVKADKIPKEQIKVWAKELYILLHQLRDVEIEKVVYQAIKEAKDEVEPLAEVPSNEENASVESAQQTDRFERIQKLYEKRGFWIKPKAWTSPKVLAHIRTICGKLMDAHKLTEDQLIALEADLIEQIKLI